MNLQLQHVLAKIAALFNQHSISWAIGSSCTLFYHGLDVSPNDLDIFIETSDVTRSIDLLKELGTMEPLRTSLPYLTTHFYEFKIDGVEVDLLAQFRIVHKEGVYDYPFSPQHIDSFTVVEDIEIPLIAVEDWYVLYQIMPHREPKVLLLELYFREHPVMMKYIDVMLKGEVPSSIRNHTLRTLDLMKHQ